MSTYSAGIRDQINFTSAIDIQQTKRKDSKREKNIYMSSDYVRKIVHFNVRFCFVVWKSG